MFLFVYLHVFLFSGFMGCILFWIKIEFHSSVWGFNAVSSFITVYEQLPLNRGCYFPMESLLSGDFFSDKQKVFGLTRILILTLL